MVSNAAAPAIAANASYVSPQTLQQAEAPRPMGYQMVGVNPNLPLNQRYPFNPDEQAQVNQAMSRIVPKRMFGVSFSTPVLDTFCSPAKFATLVGLGTGLLTGVGAMLVPALEGGRRGRGIGLGLAIGAVTALVSGIGTFIDKRQQMENYQEVVQRIWPRENLANITMRDVKSDPLLHEEDQYRRLQASNTQDAFTNALVYSALSSAMTPRYSSYSSRYSSRS